MRHCNSAQFDRSFRYRLRVWAVFWLCLQTFLVAGCVSWDINSARRLATVVSWNTESAVKVRKRPRNPLEIPLNLVGRGGPKLSPRAEQTIRRYALQDSYRQAPEETLLQFYKTVNRERTTDLAYTWAELAYIRGLKQAGGGHRDEALRWFSASAALSFEYLFDDGYQPDRSEFDPAFRRICDIYNQAVEEMLRILKKQDRLKSGEVIAIESIPRDLSFVIQIEGRWENDKIADVKFASDLEVTGLENQYHSFGLGVPLVAARADSEVNDPEKQFLAPQLTFPLTAFFQVIPAEEMHTHPSMPADIKCVLQLYDPLEKNTITINGKRVPLESDITTPLAYYLKDPLLNTDVFATLALIDGNFAKQFRGLYMLEPFDPEKIPVVMVHGLWSSPVTWTEMFNDLRADPEIRENYQFWFYLYPSGQPFWVSAKQMRNDLQQVRQTVDPYRQSVPLNEMVLIGHSMGGLLSRLQTVESGNNFWNVLSDQPFGEIQGEPEAITNLQNTFYFSPNPSVTRVITLGTPHRGSDFANSATRWISRRLFQLPKMLTQQTSSLVKENRELFKSPELLTVDTSVDSLALDSPFFEALASSQQADWVRYHNIVGEYQPGGLSGYLYEWFSMPGDGVVPLESATSVDSVSQVVVPAEHSSIHRHPRSILEVRRILHQHVLDISANKQVIKMADRLSGQGQATEGGGEAPAPLRR